MGTNDSNNIKVGIFVATGVLFLMVTIIMLGGDTTFFKDYTTFYGKFKQVQGLEAGSVVTLSGMKVGNVQELTLSKEGEIIVSFTIDKKMAHRVTDKSIVTVKTQGALGDKFLFITPEPGTPLQAEAFIQVDNKPDLFDTIAEKGTDIAALADVVSELKQLLVNLNENDRSALFMKNMVKASAELSPTIQRFKSILDKMDKGEGSLGALINDPVLHDKLISLLGESPRNKYLKPLIRATIKKNESAR